MILSALLIAGWTITTLSFLRALNSERRQHARERDLLLNQLLHAVDRPWQPAPATVEREPGWNPPGGFEAWIPDGEQLIGAEV